MTKYVLCDIIYIVKAVRKLTFKEVEKLLKANGWKYKSTNGSHYNYVNDKGEKIPVPRHSGDIPKGTLNSILKQAGLK